jgi:YbbR domain-containing protein
MAYNPFRNLWLKFLAIALASLLWLTVAGEHIVERSLRVPLEFRNIPEGIEVVGDPPAAVDVRVRGSSGILSRLVPGEVVVILDLRSARPGSRLFHLRADEVRTPYGVQVTQVAPPTLSLSLERALQRTVPIVPAIDGDPAPGFVVGRVVAEPSTVDVVGPEGRLKEIGEATTEPLSVDGANEPVTDTVTVGVSDPAVRLREPESARVTVEIVPAPNTVRVTVRGGRDVLDSLGSDGINAFVDLAGLGPGRYNLRVRADPASTFGVVRIDPPAADVRVR